WVHNVARAEGFAAGAGCCRYDGCADADRQLGPRSLPCRRCSGPRRGRFGELGTALCEKCRALSRTGIAGEPHDWLPRGGEAAEARAGPAAMALNAVVRRPLRR